MLRKALQYTLLASVFLCPSLSYAQASTSQVDMLAQLAALQKMLAELQANVATAKSSAAPGAATHEWQYDRPNNIPHEDEDMEDIANKKDRVSVFRIQDEKAVFYDRRLWSDADKDLSQEVWSAFRTVAGSTFIESNLDEFLAFDIEESSTLGFVRRFGHRDPTWTRPQNKGDGWGLGVNIAHTDFESETAQREVVVTLLHEYAHIETLNDTQIEYDINTESFCAKKHGTYFLPLSTLSARGCSKADSYVNAFAKKFWTEKQQRSSRSAWAKKNAEGYYEKHEKEFVTWYATKNPLEDIAESFADFILMPKPTGEDIRDQKIRFFYEYPELVTLRKDMRARIAAYFD